MASKKITLLALLVSLGTSGAFAQMAGTLNLMDSSKFNAKKMAQYNEWANGLPSSPFAPKPRDAWQLNVFGGYSGIFGDVNTAPGWGVGIGARKAIGYVVSVRPSLMYRQIKGMSYEKNGNIRNLPNNVQDVYRNAGLTSYAHYYKTEMWAPSVDFLVSLNNIMFHRKQSNYNYYLVAGYSPIIYNTGIEALGTDGTPHDYRGVEFDQKRGDIIDQLNTYYESRNNGEPDFETPARVRGRRNNFDDATSESQWVHGVNFGAGVERRLGDVVTLSAEFKYTTVWNRDWIDGYAIGLANAYTPNSDALFTGNIGVNFNLGLIGRKKASQQAGKDEIKKDLGDFSGKRVAPLWMHNPLSQPFGELSNPTRMNMPKGWLEDSDNDGVPDQFDLEPNTPAGAPVDSRGRTRDTDGDGVPDYLDKELITPTACQPVNADGVGKCPDPECCNKIPVAPPAPACNIGSLPSVQFASGRSGMSSSATAILDAAASQILANPNCKICVVGHGGSSKREQQLSWDRVNAVINYLNEKKGISRDRFVFKYGEAGDPNTVDLQDCTGEEGPNNVPPPHPQYRTSK
ncbi:MAG: OmpA family protein [Chitinophagaceae bacterium]|nr:OmpA family protein [Chitinophagaceae bacterium]